jgi:hypothetical protein
MEGKYGTNTGNKNCLQHLAQKIAMKSTADERMLLK